MKISEKWLREWVSPEIDTRALAHQLTMAGLEVDSVEKAAADFSKVVVAEVIDVSPHPNADKLRVCQVNTGANEAVQIGCGAANVRAGMRVPAALIGAILPGDFKIKKSKLRGVESFGMLCSAVEIGMAEQSDGLMELPADAPVGQDVRTFFNLDDAIIEIDFTPNRGDCLSIAGVAREVGVLNRCAVTTPVHEVVTNTITEQFPVEVSAVKDCPRYLGRIVRGINPQAETPLWMQEKLRRGGIRSLGPLVDITNYVLLELGHPMHAFDLDKLSGGIQVRRANQDECLTLLDGKTITLDSEVLVISDQKKPLAIAGIMGGDDTAVGDHTCNVFLECAFFHPIAIAGKARQFGLQTDSSYRFERGVDPNQLQVAMERATKLLIEIAGGEAGPVTEVLNTEHMPRRDPIELRAARIRKILGLELEPAEVEDILQRLGMQIEKTAQGWMVQPPSFRFDISIEVDLIEELGRIHGYDQLPVRAYRGEFHMLPVAETRIGQERIHGLLQSRGYQEVITYSFVDPALQSLIDPAQQGIALANPISAEMGVMRTTLWTGLVQTAMYNLNRQQDHVRIFESGLKYISQDDEIKQNKHISGAAVDRVARKHWSEKPRHLDFFDIKADVQALLDLTGRGDQFIFTVKEHPALHPGQSACIEYRGREIGWVGALHPKLLQKLGVSETIFVFDLEWEAITEARLPEFTAVSKYPSIRRDLAVVIEETLTSDKLVECIRGILPNLLKEIRIFDVYKGKGVDSGRKSVALGLILQDSSRTLTDQDVDAAMADVMSELQKQLGATLRE